MGYLPGGCCPAGSSCQGRCRVGSGCADAVPVKTDPLYDTDLQSIAEYAADMVSACCGMPRFVQAYLQVKADSQPLMDGTYVFSVTGREKVRVCVADGRVTAENVGEEVPADIELPHLQMMNFLFAPTDRQVFADSSRLWKETGSRFQFVFRNRIM